MPCSLPPSYRCLASAPDCFCHTLRSPCAPLHIAGYVAGMIKRLLGLCQDVVIAAADVLRHDLRPVWGPAPRARPPQSAKGPPLPRPSGNLCAVRPTRLRDLLHEPRLLRALALAVQDVVVALKHA